MEHSEETIESIKKFIRQKEVDFLRTGQLVPITQTECAEHVGVHASTVCRIIKSGVKIKIGPKKYPISFFFSQRKIHPEEFNAWINRMIEHEDPSDPISDKELLRVFNEEFQEYALKLRTIIKYRSKSGIGSKHARRRKVQHWMSGIIKNEDPQSPLSDQMLAEHYRKEFPGSDIKTKQIENLRKRAGIKESDKRRKKYVIKKR